ncbi:cation:proton antiporter [Candidatus Uhrbacteria bacterium]|nr:cation:proton antiporter [Candidatus Uhrbacteria bacterium]
MLEELFFEIGIVLVIAAGLSMMLYRLRQPLIVAYIITGILVGPGLLALTRSTEVFDVMSEIGVAFLLFTVGLGLNWQNVKDVGGIAFVTGVGQVLFTSVVGFFVGTLIGFDPITSLYLGVAFAFSSTIIIIKLLMDKEDLDTLYGRISVGFLLVQDFIAMLILLGLNAVGSGADIKTVFFSIGFKALLLIPALWLVSTKILPPVLKYVARSQELLFIFSVAWCFLVAELLVFAGFGVELGALMAGITLSSSVYYRQINARIRPLRDFFLIMFFIVLGTRLGLDQLSTTIIPAILFSVFVLIGNPLLMMFIMRSLGYHPRTGFLCGTTVAQISEFSFIVIITGISIGHLDDSVLALATAVGIITITGSSYLIAHNETIFQKIQPVFRWLEPKTSLASEHPPLYSVSNTILFGFHRTGAELLSTIKQWKQSYVIVDFDPATIRQLAEAGEPCVYGDAGDERFLEEIKTDKARLIVSTIPDFVISAALLTFLQSRSYKGITIVTVHTHTEAQHCYELGATYVILPSVLSGKKFSEILEKKKSVKRSWSVLKKQLDV